MITFLDDIFGEQNTKANIVLLHPAMGNRQLLVYTCNFLAEKGYRVISFDFPGLGSRLNEKLTIETAITATKEIIEKQFVESY